MNTLAHLTALLAITDFAIDMFTVFNEQTLGVVLVGLWFLYVALSFKAMLDDWKIYMTADFGDVAQFSTFSAGAVVVVLFIVGIKVAHTIWG